jgi:hypothetical protein
MEDMNRRGRNPEQPTAAIGEDDKRQGLAPRLFDC